MFAYYGLQKAGAEQLFERDVWSTDQHDSCTSLSEDQKNSLSSWFIMGYKKLERKKRK